MKKYLPISTGIFIGIGIFVLMINLNFSHTVYGEDTSTWWQRVVAKSNTDWDDIFSPFSPEEKGKDIYDVLYNKLHIQADNTALREIANQNGLTTQEAQSVLHGSITPIFNNPRIKSIGLSQEEAVRLMNNLQEEFKILQDLYQTQNEVDVSISPSEIFANDDLADSGFDLVHDLSVIEEILFLEFTPNTVGAPYEDALTTPYNPADLDKYHLDNIESATAKAVLPLQRGGSDDASADAGKNAPEAEILDNDVCPENNSIDSALKNLDSELEQEKTTRGDEREEGDDDGGADEQGTDKDDVDKQENISPAPAGNWIKQWCPGIQESGASTGGGFSLENLKSLGGTAAPFAAAGASAGFNTEGFSVNAGLCLDVKLVRETLSSYQPSDSCILCEVEKIIELLDKTLSHTLIPGKATGNLLESAKCKKSGTLLNLQFITIRNPIPTPPNDDLIFGKNIFEEWNKFTERYQPFLLDKITFDIEDRPDLSDDFTAKFLTKFAPPGTSQSEIFSQLNSIKAQNTAKASLDVKNEEEGNEVTDITLYSQKILGEMRQMNALFTNFKNTFNKIYLEAITQIKAKKKY